MIISASMIMPIDMLMPEPSGESSVPEWSYDRWRSLAEIKSFINYIIGKHWAAGPSKERVGCAKKKGSLNFALWSLFCILHNCQMIDYRSLVPLSEDRGSLSSAVCLPILLWWFVGLLSEILVASSRETALLSKRIVPNFRTIRSLLTTKKQLAEKSFSGVYVSIKCLWVSVYSFPTIPIVRPIFMSSLVVFYLAFICGIKRS